MENVILSGEQMSQLAKYLRVGDNYFKDLCKFQAKHLLRILQEPCVHCVGDFHDNERAVTMISKFNCPDCMELIEKEIEG